MPVTKGTLKELFAQNWDVVVFQQISTKSYDYATFNPYLTNLIFHVKEDCPNKQVLIAWQMTWSYWKDFSISRPKGEQGWQDIVDATKEMMHNVGIRIIIPTGTAIENARHSFLNTAYDLTDDGRHLCRGVGRYVAACTWFEALLKPVFDVSVVGNGARYYEADRQAESFNYEAPLVDTDETAEACQWMAKMAVSQWDRICLFPEGQIKNVRLIPDSSNPMGREMLYDLTGRTIRQGIRPLRSGLYILKSSDNSSRRMIVK